MGGEQRLVWAVGAALLAAVTAAVATRREVDATASGRWPLAAAVLAAFGVAAAVARGVDPVRAGIVATAFAVCALVDARTRLVYPEATFLPALALLAWSTVSAPPTPLAVGLGAAASLVVWGIVYAIGRLLFRQEALAQGDLFLAVLTGAAVGIGGVPAAALLGMLLNGAWALVLVVRGRSQTFFPYGPLMCAGAWVALLLARG